MILNSNLRSSQNSFADFLKSDFPRIPLPGGAEVFRALVPLGQELVALHLLDETHQKMAKPSIRFAGKGDNRLAKKGDIKLDNGKMMINATQWFEDVPEASVEFAIGGYQPLKKWLPPLPAFILGHHPWRIELACS